MSAISLFPRLDRLRINASHYDSITEAWRHIFGDNFHFGYFLSPDSTLDEATDALIDKMASLGAISDGTKLLDVGCGIGTPAFYLHRGYGCDITGISPSEAGIAQAEKECKKRGYEAKVRFRLGDGLNNGFDDDAFDVVWIMESSHLMKDKKRLFAECFRVLKPRGVMLLCDIMFRRPYTLTDRLGYLARMKLGFVGATLSNFRSFGWIQMETFETYIRSAREVGFVDVVLTDISEQAIPTFECWKSNLLAKEESVLKTLTQGQIKSFLTASDFSKDLFEREIDGYGILRASKRG
ncbi:MAG: methyltransferase domain-containing protein [Deltaproteobacteria bacterium]|nr:methyltransferase domain-containing protein [Deltaproteobacteria bacterium]